MVGAIVDVGRAIESGKSSGAFARVMRKMINASPAVLARVKLLGAESDLVLAVLAREPLGARTSVRSDFIDARGVVLAKMAQAVVDVHFAPGAIIAQRTFPPKKRSVQF